MADTLRILDACCAGEESIVRDLLARDPSLANAHGFPIETTPLILAAHRGYRTLVEMLLAASASIDAREGASDTTALHWAAEGGHPDVVQMLLEHGANIEAVDGWYALGPLGWSTFASWAPHRHRDRMGASSTLLDRGARLDPFSAIILRRAQSIDPQDVSRRLGWKERGRAPLHLAVKRQDEEAVDTLLRLGADPHLVDDFGVTPAAEARPDRFEPSNNDLSFAIARSDWPRAQAIGGLTIGLLAWAAENDRSDAVRFLVGQGVDPNELVPHLVKELPSRVSPLHLAVENGALSSARELLAAGALVNASDPKAGMTALHVAASRGLRPMVALLLEHGADPNIKDAIHSATPLGFAEYCRQEDVAAILQAVTLRHASSVLGVE